VGEGEIINARTTLTATKTSELVAEAIPGTLIQLSAIFKQGSSNISSNAKFSILFSIVTAGFTSAMISYDWDTALEERRYAPWFYGYVGRNAFTKFKIFTLLFLLALFNLITRSMACVLISLQVNGLYSVAMLLGLELLMYYAVKIMRQDLRYWVPLYGLMGGFAAMMIRWIVKLVSDWTAVAQFRHPNEVGGAYFTATLGFTAIMGIMAALGYKKDESITSAWEGDVVLGAMCLCCFGMIVSFGCLLGSIDSEYITTFFTTKTSNQSLQEEFTRNTEDEHKFAIFTHNRFKWEYAIGGQVKKWLNNRLAAWIVEEPEWFKKNLQGVIPHDFVEDKELLRSIKNDPSKMAKEISIKLAKIAPMKRNVGGGGINEGNPEFNISPF